MRLQPCINNFQTHTKDNNLEHFLINQLQVNAATSHWWSVKIGPVSGFASPDNTPLPGADDPGRCRHMASLRHIQLSTCVREFQCLYIDNAMEQLISVDMYQVFPNNI